MKKNIIFILLSFTFTVYAQDIHFSQIQETPLWLNPANAGFFNGYFRVAANYRNQWASMGNAFQTMAISVDAAALKTKKNKGYLGIGLFVFNDKAGVAKIGSTQAQLHVNGIIKTSKRSKIAGAVYGGYNQNTINYSLLTFGNQYTGKQIDRTVQSGEILSYESFSNMDAGVGLNYEYSTASAGSLRDDVCSIKIGGAIHHINKPVQRYNFVSIYKLPMRFVGNVQARIDFKDTKFTLLPSVIYLQQGSTSEINIGAFFRYRFKNATKITGNITEAGLNVGAYVRLQDAIIPQVNLDMGKYAIGVSYDYNFSKYNQVSKGNGGFEIFLKWMSLDDALFKRKREHGLN